MGSYFNKRRVLSLILLSMLVFTTLSSAFATVVSAEPSSSTRQQQFFDMARGKGASDITSIDQLTAEDMRILGVFLSNFYVPWQTRLSEPGGESNSETIQGMTDALVTNCGFNEDLAKQIVDACWNISLSMDNVKPLKIATYEGGTVGGVSSRGGESSPANYDELLAFMQGGIYAEELAVTSKYKLGKYCLYWTDSAGTDHVVMESFDENSMTASAFSYAMALSGVDYDGGIGSNLTNASSIDDAKKIGEEKGEDFVSKWGLFIDTFGNIIVDCKSAGGQYVLVPACLNAYTWTDASGTAGQQVPLVNLLSIGNTVLDGKEGSKLRISFNKTKGKYEVGINGKLLSGAKSVTWKAYRGLKSGEDWIGNELAEYGESELVAGVVKDMINQEDFPTWSKFYKGVEAGSSVSFIDDFVFIDSLSSFKSGSSTFTTLNQDAGIFSTDTDTGSNGDTYYKPMEAFRSGYASSNFYSVQNGSKFIADKGNAKAPLVGIYLSYIFAYEGDSTVGYRFNSTGLPPLKNPTARLFSVTETTEDSQLKQIKSMIYYFLHPSEGGEYIKQWFKTKSSALLVGIHESIVGSGSSANLGVTKYVGFSGYVTTPELKDLSWTALILDKYDSVFVFLVIAIVIVLAGYVMLGSLSFQKAFIGIGIFAICAYLPPTLIDATIGISNKVATTIYGQKFVYWALIQHQTYATKISASAEGSSYDDYLVTLYKENASMGDSNAVSVSLKWMCPKKNNYMFTVQQELENHSGYKLLGGMLNTQLSGQTFVDSKGANYLYRSYTDINNYSKYLYKISSEKGTNSIATGLASEVGVTVSDYYDALDKSYNSGFSVMNSRGRRNATDNDGTANKINLRWRTLYTSDEMGSTLSKKVEDATLSGYLGISQTDLQYDLSSINNLTTNDTKAGLHAFVQYTESPFYYFSWNLYDQGLSSSIEGSTGAFKDLMLGDLTGGKDSYFYNTKATDSSYGEVRDYLDMKSLFTVVIPYLKKSNDQVIAWDKTYGLSTYEGVSCDPAEGMTNASDDDKYKHWHNVNVAQLWNMYTPWVDTMYDCSYAKEEEIKVGGKTVIIKDPLDPKSYPGESGGRPMIFSKSEMKYWGISEKDLTQVEAKILKVGDSTMADLYYMMNYYTFDDSVLNTSTAMLTTFNFNSTFSESSILSGNRTLQPQAFELKNFSYDAYLRLIMANATGESLLSDGSLYQTIIENSSIVTGGLLVVNDILACYLVSGLKLFFLVALFFMAVVMVLVATISLELNLASTLWRSLVLPLIKFLGISIGHALVVSFFMSDGNVNITGKSSTAISLGDPTLTLAIMVIVNAVVVLLYFKVVKGVAKDLVKYTKAVATSMAGVAGGLATGLVGGALLGGKGGKGEKGATGEPARGGKSDKDLAGARLRGKYSDKENRSTTDLRNKDTAKAKKDAGAKAMQSDIDTAIKSGQTQHEKRSNVVTHSKSKGKDSANGRGYIDYKGLKPKITGKLSGGSNPSPRTKKSFSKPRSASTVAPKIKGIRINKNRR